MDMGQVRLAITERRRHRDDEGIGRYGSAGSREAFRFEPRARSVRRIRLDDVDLTAIDLCDDLLADVDADDRPSPDASTAAVGSPI